MAFIWMLLVDLMLLPIWILKMLLIILLIWLGILDLMEDFLKLSISVIRLWEEKIITMLMSIHLEPILSKYEYYFLKLYLLIDYSMNIYLINWLILFFLIRFKIWKLIPSIRSPFWPSIPLDHLNTQIQLWLELKVSKIIFQPCIITKKNV